MRIARVRGDDAQARLARALRSAARLAGCELTIDASSTRPWASATFVGEQQALAVRLSPTAAAREWLAALPDADLPMRGYVAMPPTVAGVADQNGEVNAKLAVLTLIDG